MGLTYLDKLTYLNALVAQSHLDNGGPTVVGILW